MVIWYFVFCLRKIKKTYENLFKIVTEECKKVYLILKPKNIVTDFEVAIQKAVKAVWCDVTIVGFTILYFFCKHFFVLLVLNLKK